MSRHESLIADALRRSAPAVFAWTGMLSAIATVGRATGFPHTLQIVLPGMVLCLVYWLLAFYYTDL